MSARRLVSASAANLLIPISGLLVSPFLSRELGPDGRGLYAALTLPIVICGWFGTFGLQDSLSYHLRHHRLTRWTAAKVSLAATVPLGLVGVGVLVPAGLVVVPPDHYREFVLLSLLAPLHILANLFIGVLTGSSDITGLNLVKVVPALLRTAVVIAACLLFDLSAYAAAGLFLASLSLAVVVGLVRLRRRPAPEAEPVEGAPVRSLVRYSLVCLPGVLAAISSARLDQMIGAPVIGLEQLGYYAVAVSVAEIPMVVATAARSVLMGRPDTGDPRRSAAPGRLAVAGSVVVCGLLAAAAPVAVPLVFGAPFAPAVRPTVILCLATVLFTAMVILSAALLADGRAGASSRALVTGSVVSIGLLFLLARWGAVGAACASLAGYAVSAAMCAAAVRRMAGPWSVRMLTVLYRDDVAALRARLRRKRGGTPDEPPTEVLARPAQGRAPATGHRRPESVADRVAAAVARWTGDGLATAAVSLLFVLAWLRLQLPQLIQLFSTGRPEFNSREDVAPPVSELLGDALSLGFLLVAAALAVRGVLRRERAGLPWLALALAPLLALEVAGVVGGRMPGLVSVALPLAAVAVWLQPPRRDVLGTAGVLGGITAAVSMLLAVVWPEVGMLTGDSAGAKAVFLGGLLAGPFLHSNVLGIVLALSLPFVFCVRRVLVRRAALVLILAALFWTGSRTAQFAGAAVLGTYALVRLSRTWRRLQGDRRAWGRTQQLLLAAPAAAGVVLLVLTPLLTTDPAAFTRRGQIWEALLDRFADRPVLGHGPDLFQDPGLAADLGGQFGHAHNGLVQFLVTGGVCATVLFAVLAAVVWRGAVRAARDGWLPGALFLVALAWTSWLEASHLATTLAGYLAWLPLFVLARLAYDTAADPAARAGAAQKMSVSRR
ncbi:O-antigen ligase family protein [Spirilliplanes yamanashiensis]|uniref:O-antigen ligase-related domain-containing protein n=1 Tax=Spirilliplanes yamanashiensis TaxID=42233 RepID=A0A8J3Y6Z0_9ACTN|nr:O-antigen ligase family protein [Spirilliplanes yamanashiensis]MDP9814784.1 O-antigen/teichoic acid export membrane protein/O-antigen ligase [Spirilliplanes yamanashiensis]GIJ02438.1 hypothetical protein Sya03_17900 [Spirilliplanes yamanashiensis]